MYKIRLIGRPLKEELALTEQQPETVQADVTPSRRTDSLTINEATLARHALKTLQQPVEAGIIQNNLANVPGDITVKLIKNKAVAKSNDELSEREKELLKKEEIAIDNALFLVEEATKLQSEGRNVTIGIVEEKDIDGEKVKVFNDGSGEIVVRDNSIDFKLSLLCLAVVGIILFLLYTYCLY